MTSDEARRIVAALLTLAKHSSQKTMRDVLSDYREILGELGEHSGRGMA